MSTKNFELDDFRSMIKQMRDAVRESGRPKEFFDGLDKMLGGIAKVVGEAKTVEEAKDAIELIRIIIEAARP